MSKREYDDDLLHFVMNFVDVIEQSMLGWNAPEVCLVNIVRD